MNLFFKKLATVAMVCMSVLSMLSCSRKITFDGTYYSKNAKTVFTISQNNIFNYQYSFAIKQFHSSGIWKKVGRKNIEANSYKQFKELSIEKTISNYDTSNSINIKLYLPANTLIDYEVLIFLNNKLLSVRPVNTIKDFLEVPKLRPFDNIYFGLTGGHNLPYRSLDTLFTKKIILDGDKNNVNLKINYDDSLFNYKIITRQNIKIRKKGIISNNDFYKKLK